MNDPKQSPVGWLGAGRMGSVMVTRLLDAGIDVAVWNRTRAKSEALESRGARIADTVAELGSARIVFTMVTASDDLIGVTIGEGGLLRGQDLPEVLVDCSTVSAEASAQVRAEAERRGVAFLAAPISGNPDMVGEGRAAIVASGPVDAFELVQPYLQAIAPTVVHAGLAEEARLVKLCHNLMLGMITQALVEVTALAEKGGIGNAAFMDFINGSVLASSFLAHKGRAIVERDYEPTFTAENLRKDYDIGLAAARSLEVPMPVAASLHQLIQSLIGNGYGKYDYVALYELEARGAALSTKELS